MTRNQVIFIYLNGRPVFLVNLFYFLLGVEPLWSHCESHGRCNYLSLRLQELLFGSLIPAVPSQVQFYVMYFGSLQQYITLQVLGISKLCLILFVCDHRFLPTIVIYVSYAYIGEFYYHFSPTYVKKKLVIQIH